MDKEEKVKKEENLKEDEEILTKLSTSGSAM